VSGRDDPVPALEDGLREYMYLRMDRHGCNPDPGWRESIIGDDIRLNAQGLKVWLARRSRG
jgi:hypothetical protein